MAPRQGRKRQPAFHVSESEDENSQQSSQEDMNVLKAARNVVSTIKKRRETKRKVIEAECKKRVADINAKLDAHFEARKSRITKLQKAQWDRLEALNKKRESIESQILTSMRTIEVHTMNISSELEATFSGRLEEIENGSSQRA